VKLINGKKDFAVAGWARPINSSKWHWFDANSEVSICGRWLFFGARPEPEGDHHPDNCAGCRSRKTRRQEKTKGAPRP